MSRCCHIFDLMHDVETAMLHYKYLEISTEYVWCSENFNMQFSGRLIVQTYIDTFVFFYLYNKDQIIYKSFTSKYITRPIQTNLILIKRKQLTPSTQTLHPVLHHEY